MTILARTAIAAAAAGLLAATPAAADYSIVEDAAFPSVVYIEFDPSTMPKVLTAPDSTSGLPMIQGGQADTNAAAPSSPSASTQDAPKPQDQNASSGGTIDQQIIKKIDDLAKSTPEQMEKKVIDRAIEDRILQNAPLVGTNG